MWRIFIALLVAIPTWASLGTISFTVPNCSGVVRTAEGQTAGVPIPQSSAITDVRNLMVTDNSNTIIPSHLTVTERWGGPPSDITKAIKWIRIDILTSISQVSGSQFCNGDTTQTGGGATYKLADRTGPDPVFPGVSVTTDNTCSVNCTVIDTGAVTYKFRSDYFNGPDSVTIDGGGPTLVSHSTNNGLQIVTSGGTYISASAGGGTPAYSIVVEEPNGASNQSETGANIRAQLHVTGALWNGIAKLGYYDARLIFYAGQAWYKFEPAIIYNFDLLNTSNMPTDVAYVMGTTLGAALNASFGTSYGNSGTSQTIPLTNIQDVYLSQYDHGNNFNASFLCNNDARNCPGLNLQGARIVKGTTTQFNFNQADGWMNLSDGTNSITGWMRDFWQNYPVEWEAAGDIVKIHFWPVHGDTPVDGNPNGDLTMIVGYKRDQAEEGNSGFYIFWPFQPGAAMNMTPVSPNPGRTISAATATNPATITSTGLSHLDDSANDTPCVATCLYWQPGQKHTVFLSGLGGGTWPSINNSFLLASPTTPTSTTFNLYHLDGSNLDATGFGVAVVSSAKVGGLDTQTDVNAATFGKRYEVVVSFQTGAGTPSTVVPKWRDTLLFTNPNYFCDIAQPWGRMHARDTANFLQSERELDALMINIKRKDLFFNNYGMPYWGVVQYSNNGATAAGFAQRYLVTFRKNRMFVPWVQWLRTGDPTFYQIGRVWAWFGGEVPVQHVPSYQRDSGAGVYFDTWHLQEGTGVDAVGNVLIKHNGGITCTEGWGSSLWFNNYNVNTTNPVAPPGATTQRCPDGQQPYLEFPTAGLLADYLIGGDYRDATLVTDVADNVLFSASGSAHNNIVCGATEPGCGGVDSAQLFVSGGNTGPAVGRSFGGCMQVASDAHELTWSQGSTHNYFSLGLQCLKAGTSATNNFTRWFQNPVGFQSFSFGVPSTRYGQDYFATNWSHYNLPNFADIVGNISIPAPTFAVAPANVSINLFDVVTKLGKSTGYVNGPSATGLMSFLTPGRVMASAYHYTGDTILRDMMKRELDFFVMGADDDISTTGCKNLGSISSTGVIPITNCTLTTGAPDPHVYVPFALGVPYWEYELFNNPPSIVNLPPIGWQIPASGATNGPLKFLVNNPNPGATVTVSFMLRAENSSSFTGGSPVLPSGDITLQVLDPSNNPVSVAMSNASGTVSVSGTTVIVKTPTQEAPAMAVPGTTSCLTAPDPPSINYTLDGNNNLDNRYWTITFSGAAAGEYKYQFTSAVCPGGATFHIATPVATSTGNIDTVICTAPCSTASNFIKAEVGAAYYLKVPNGVTKLQTDSTQVHTLVDPNGTFYRGNTVLSTPLVSGFWKVNTFGAWQDYTTNVVSFGGVGGVKPLASPSPATYWDSPSYSNQTFVSLVSNAITLNFSGASISTASPLPSGIVGTPITPVTFACSGCGAISSWSVIAGSLPTGLALGGALNATLSGTPTVPNTYNFTIQATDGVNNPTKPFTMVVNGAALGDSTVISGKAVVAGSTSFH